MEPNLDFDSTAQDPLETPIEQATPEQIAFQNRFAATNSADKVLKTFLQDSAIIEELGEATFCPRINLDGVLVTDHTGRTITDLVRFLPLWTFPNSARLVRFCSYGPTATNNYGIEDLDHVIVERSVEQLWNAYPNDTLLRVAERVARLRDAFYLERALQHMGDESTATPS